MNTTTAWRTDEPCPTCGKDLTLLDDGALPIRWQRRLCGDELTELVTPGGDE